MVEAPTSIGGYLARQRQLRGISLEELAAITRIPRRSLERLESGAFDEQADGFARGFVRTVAAAIGLDPDEAVNRMRVEPEPTGRVGLSDLGRAAVALAAVFLLVAALVSGIAWLGGMGGGSDAEPSREELPVRRDAVRALAEREGLFGAERAPVTLSPPPAAEPAEPGAP